MTRVRAAEFTHDGRYDLRAQGVHYGQTNGTLTSHSKSAESLLKCLAPEVIKAIPSGENGHSHLKRHVEDSEKYGVVPVVTHNLKRSRDVAR
jgi:hypothetical protein